MSDPNKLPENENLEKENTSENEAEANQEETVLETEVVEEEQTTEEQTTEEETTEDPAKEETLETPSLEEEKEEISEEKNEVISEESQEEDEEITSSDDDENDDDEEDVAQDYHNLSQEELIAALKKLLQTDKIQDVKKQVEEIKNEFYSNFDDELQEKKEDFLARGGNYIDFHYTTPQKSAFDSLYFEYREKRNNYYKKLKKDLQGNLQKRLDLIEELKGLITLDEDINQTFKQFKTIQERWKEIGPIPRDGYNTVWNNYHHHVEIFYDYVHLNRDFRDLDFKHNLEEKLKIVSRTEELVHEPNINKAFRELQMLHKIWKEETGPVAKEYREEIWERFSNATKIIHDKRAAQSREVEKDFEENLRQKKEIIEAINKLVENTKDNHKDWQQGIKTLESLRSDFFKIGKVPAKDTEKTWANFKDAVRIFNKKKNQFYKNQKREQFDNLQKKQALIEIAQQNKDSEDFDAVTPLIKKIQQDWKTIGHVPRRDSDKVWKEFKEACDHYFNRLHAERNQGKKEEQEAFEKKSVLLENLQQAVDSGSEIDLKEIKSKIAEWKEIGRVPFAKKNIDGKFNKMIDGLFKKLDMSKKEVELLKYDNKLDNITSHDDERKVQNELYFITKKIDEVKQDINQQENNLGFFQYVDDKNPMVRDVHKNIQKLKDELELLQAKLRKLKEVI